MRIIKLLCLLFILSSCNKYLGVVDKDYIPTGKLDDIFANAIIDYVLFRCYLKDAEYHHKPTIPAFSDRS